MEQGVDKDKEQNNCKDGKRKKISFGLKKIKYMTVKTRRAEDINKAAKAGRIHITDKCKYLRITISTDGQLTEDIKELSIRCDIIKKRNMCKGAKTQVGKEEVRVKLKQSWYLAFVICESQMNFLIPQTKKL